MGTTVELLLSGEEYAALRKFLEFHPRRYTVQQGCRLFIRDQLIAMGLLKLPEENRGRGARR